MFIDTRSRLAHILEFARKANSYTEGRTRSDLDEDEPVAAAVTHYCSIVGEAAKHVDRNFQHAHPEVRWKVLADLRNKFLHDYYEVDLNVVWSTATVDFPKLIAEIEKLLAGDIP